MRSFNYVVWELHVICESNFINFPISKERGLFFLLGSCF